MKKLAAFDLDGTLSQSDRFLLPAYRKGAYAYRRDPLPDSLLMTLIGGTAADNARVISPDGSMETYEEFNFHVVQAIRGTIPVWRAPIRGWKRASGNSGGSAIKSISVPTRGANIPISSSGRSAAAPLRRHARGPDGWDKPQLLAHILETERPGAAVMVGDRTSTGRRAGKRSSLRRLPLRAVPRGGHGRGRGGQKRGRAARSDRTADRPLSLGPPFGGRSRPQVASEQHGDRRGKHPPESRDFKSRVHGGDRHDGVQADLVAHDARLEDVSQHLDEREEPG